MGPHNPLQRRQAAVQCVSQSMLGRRCWFASTPRCPSINRAKANIMVSITKLTVTNAKRIDTANWLTVRDVFGPQEIPDPSPRGDCVVQADTGPQNNAAEWSQIVWNGAEPIPGKPNQRRIRRQATAQITITASIGSTSQRCVLWALWVDVSVLTTGPRPPHAKPWSEGEAIPGPDQCGAFEVPAFSMGKNARGQIVTVAKLFPSGVGRIIDTAKKQQLFNIRRQLTGSRVRRQRRTLRYRRARSSGGHADGRNL